MKIVFLDRATPPPLTRLKQPGFPHDLTLHDRTATGEAAGRIADAEIVITNKVRLSASALERAPNLRMIAVAATGSSPELHEH